MERFLSRCAEYIFQRHSSHLHEVSIVFPNRRAGVFFNYYLQKQLKSPVIGPHVTTVNEFIAGYSNLQQGEKLQLISDLFGVFKRHTQSAESFDEFFFWGEVLLSDFNDIDHYLVDAKDLFSNVADLKEIDQLFDYLTPEQKNALSRFWGSIPASGKKAHQEKFFTIWQKLYPVYCDFKKLLTTKNRAYSGMISRQVAEIFRDNAPVVEFQKLYIVGLNALNSCEKIIFKNLGTKAEFLWDYDDFYLDDVKNEAGKFLRENLKQFPPPDDFHIQTSSFSQAINMKLVAVPSVYGQAQEITHFLNAVEPEVKSEFDDCAIVLADESLLYPALGAIPEKYESINVTMGYPVKNSVVYGFLLLLLNLLKNRRRDKEGRVVAYHRFVTDVLNHQLLMNVAPEKNRIFLEDMKKYNRITVPLNDINFSDFHRLIFSLPEKVNDYSSYLLNVLGAMYAMAQNAESENRLLPELIHSLYQAVEKIGKMIQDVQKEQGREINEPVFIRLFGQYAGQASVAFEGEPWKGMQVMGILETRCLDFKNLVILGLNENKWPRAFTAPSFIPYNIRKGFGLPGIDEQDAMYAYYFYRLIQRAKNVTATYSTIKEGIGTGELSRYGYQLLYGTTLEIQKSTLDFRFYNEPAPPVVIEGSPEKTNVLIERNSPEIPLSPTAINMWLQCRLRFYFRYILQLSEPDEMKDEIDSPVFGSIFHETIENLYRPLVGKTVGRADLEGIATNELLIENEITKAIGKHYFKREIPGKVYLEGKAILFFENIKTFLQRLIEIDLQLVPFELISLEKKLSAPLLITAEGKFREVHLGGTIDRVDKVNGKYRVIDYKTGNVESFSMKEVDELFEKDKEKPKKEILQALIYCHVFQQNSVVRDDLQPAVYSLRRLFEENFSPELKINKTPLSYQEIQPEFIEKLQELVTEIFSADVQYYQTPHEKYCQYCSYNRICQRY
ncbi:MAG: PD-(D/E)XK nuclease family protein [Prolixibacteraceae bacterium]